MLNPVLEAAVEQGTVPALPQGSLSAASARACEPGGRTAQLRGAAHSAQHTCSASPGDFRWRSNAGTSAHLAGLTCPHQI